MVAISTTVKKHVEAAIAEAAETGYSAEDTARSMLSFVMAIYREHREIPDIIEELQYTIDNLDPNKEHAFMRP
ncbi:hypothetical protein [Minwuia sp.]|uniref:hypothetical protein n=1 Tax=Minwuia sp. TaxID=2493630 RepID=UPI003A8E59E9